MFRPFCLYVLLCPACAALADQQPRLPDRRRLPDQLSPDDAAPRDAPRAAGVPDDG